MKKNVLPVLHTRVPNAFTCIIIPENSSNRIRTGNPVCLLGSNWVEGVDKDLTGVKLLPTPIDLLRHRSSINDNYCVQFVTGKGSPVAVTGKDCFVIQSVETRTQLPVYYPVVTHVLFAEGSSQKKDVIPEHQMLIKSVVFCTKCHKCPTCCTKSSCRVKIARF